MNQELIKLGAKYGPLSLVAIYLIYFMTGTVTTELAAIRTSLALQTEILADIRYSIKAQSGITFREVQFDASTEDVN